MGIEQYPQLLREIIVKNAHVDNPFIVVFTQGVLTVLIMNMPFWQGRMDVPLVTSRDLYVENDKVYVKTIKGSPTG